MQISISMSPTLAKTLENVLLEPSRAAARRLEILASYAGKEDAASQASAALVAAELSRAEERAAVMWPAIAAELAKAVYASSSGPTARTATNNWPVFVAELSLDELRALMAVATEEANKRMAAWDAAQASAAAAPHPAP